MRRVVALAVATLAGGWLAVQASEAETANTLTQEERTAGWRLLFDGKGAAGWRGYRKTEIPSGWQVKDGALTRTADAGDIVAIARQDHGDLVADRNIKILVTK